MLSSFTCSFIHLVSTFPVEDTTLPISMTDSNTPAKGPVAVSGVTGFIGAQVAKELLERGYVVHGTARTNNPQRLTHLTSLPQAANLRIFEADLLTEGSFDAALAGCVAAAHVASPYVMNVRDAQKELIEPALKGTLNFLASCNRQKVHNVVITSSISAMTAGGEPAGKVLTEADWNTHATASFLPYYYSKTVAERAAWDFVLDSDIKLVTINPGAVYGPSLVPALGESAGLFKTVVERGLPGVLDFAVPSVDVRDVAVAHVLALESTSAEGRYLCCCDEPFVSVRDLVRIGKEVGFAPNERDLSSPLVSKIGRVVSHLDRSVKGQITRQYLGQATPSDNTKIRNDLGMSFRKVDDMIRDTYNDMIKWGHITLPPSK